MPLFTQRESRPAWFDETDQSQWLRPGLGDYLDAAAGDAWEGLPTVALGRLGEMAALSTQATGTDVELDESGTPVISHERQPMSILPTEEQASIIDAHGLKGQITPQPGYSRDMLDVVMEHKKAELARQATREAAPGIYAPLGFATELGISLFDPINVASAFVPVVGEARVLSMLGRASGALGRAGVRAGVGTVEGAVGAAMVEPVIALAQTQQQADYDMSDALGNIAFGVAFGAALHPAAGAVGDWLRSRRGQRQPWQIMPDTDESLDLMRRHRDAIRDARISAGADETRAAEESAAAAALFDARARRWAYDFNQPVAAFYDRYMPDYRAVREGKDALSQAALYEQTPMGDAARASLERDVHDFGAAVDNIVAAGKLPSNPVKMLGQTPLVMQLLGRDTVTGKAAAQGGIHAAPHIFDGTHPNMTPEMWKQIPAAMADPIAVFDSDSPAGRARGDLVFMLELTDANGATVVVPVALQAKGKLGARINIVKSAYAKESGGVPSNHWFMRQVKKNARYVNGQKWKHWRDIGSGADSPLVVPTNASGNTIYSEADLVNLREAQPALYQPPAGARDPRQRFADMPLIEADSTQWFGPGKAIDTDSRNMRKAVHDWARTAFPQGTTVSNADTGWGVQVTPSGIKASLHHGYDELLARSVPFIPQIIESGIHLDSIEKKPGLMSHIFANKIRLDGQDYVVGFVLREDRTGNRFYDHELTKIISPDWLKPGRDTSEEALGHRTNRGISPDSLNADRFPDGSVVHAARANRGNVMNILRERLGVNDGTGQVLFQTAYHGTPHRFDEFSLEHIGTGEGAQAHGWGLYFAQDRKVSEDYPNNGRAVGSISPEIARTLRLDKPGAIVLDDIGLQHIEDRHGKEIRGLGFADARAFVDAVLADVSAVYDVDGGGRKYDLVSRTMTPQGRVMVRLEFAETGDFYSIATAGTVRKKYYEKKLPLWESANLNHSPKGTPDATFSGQSGMRQDAAGKISLAIGNREVNGEARARVTFDAAEGGRAVIEFFSAADASSAPHELYHIFRREMAESAARPDAPQRVREDWARIEEFVGAEPGQTWTREMEEKFARAGERFLLEGKAPTPALQGVFERLRQWFLELYANADAAGLHISPAMREVFGNMLSVPAAQGDMAFRKALGELLSRPVDPVEPAAVPPLPADAPPLETMQAMTVEAEQDLDRALGELEQALPEGTEDLRAVYDAEAALIDADIQKSIQVRAVLEEAARCEMRN